MKRAPVRDALDALGEAMRPGREDRRLSLVRASLSHRSNLVVARAARAARDAELGAVADDLVAAFARFLEDPIRRDPGCSAKHEIVRALLALDHPARDVYLAGVSHVQREPAFGGPIDTAPELRAVSAMALVVTEHPAALTACVGLLVDRDPAARAGGLRALSASGRPDVALVMRLFALRGDPEPGVLAEAFGGLLLLTVNDAIPFVADSLAAADVDIARAAAMALGEARGSDAIAALRARLPSEDRRDVRHTIIVALASSRDDQAFDTLLELVATGAPADSKAAAEALGMFAHDEALQGRVRAALELRSSRPAGSRRRPAR